MVSKQPNLGLRLFMCCITVGKWLLCSCFLCCLGHCVGVFIHESCRLSGLTKSKPRPHIWQ